MTIDTTKESVCINQLVGIKSENRIIEGDMIVPDIKPDILNVIRSSGNVCIYKKEVLEGKIKIDGTLQVYIIYSADDETGSIRTLNTSLDFTEIIQMQNAIQDMNLIAKTKVINVDTKVLNGRKINIKGSVNFSLKLYLNENLDIIKQIEGVDDIQKLSHDIEVNSLIGQGCTKAFAKETISIDPAYNLAEILNVELNVTNKDTKISYNKVLVKADANIQILYITEDGNIKSCQSTIPAMGFIDIPNIAEGNLCQTDFELKNLLVKPNNEEDHSIYVEAEFEICCFAYEKKDMTVIEDLYSLTKNLSYTQKLVKLIGNKTSKCDVYMIKETIPTPELVNKIICNVNVTPVIFSQNVVADRVNYDGELQINVLYSEVNENRLDTKDIRIPFQFSSEVENKGEIETEIEVQRQDFILLPDGNLDTRIDLNFIMNSTDIKDISVIDEITFDENISREDCSMVIYFTKPGDTLWKIAKKFGSTVDEIARINGIENPDALQIGKQLYIPRYCTRQSA